MLLTVDVCTRQRHCVTFVDGHVAAVVNTAPASTALVACTVGENSVHDGSGGICACAPTSSSSAANQSTRRICQARPRTAFSRRNGGNTPRRVHGAKRMARVGASAGSNAVPLAIVGAIVIAVVCVSLTAILVSVLVHRKEPAITGDAAGVSLIESNGDGQTVLYPLTALTGLEYEVADGALRIQARGWTSDTDRLSLITSYNVYEYMVAQAGYTYAQLYSDEGTLMYHTSYDLYLSLKSNVSGLVVAVFELPPAFLSPPTVDGAETINPYGLFQASCSGLNNADGSIVPIIAFAMTYSTGWTVTPTPVLSMTLTEDPYGATGLGLHCSISITAPVAP